MKSGGWLIAGLCAALISVVIFLMEMAGKNFTHTGLAVMLGCDAAAWCCIIHAVHMEKRNGNL